MAKKTALEIFNEFQSGLEEKPEVKPLPKTEEPKRSAMEIFSDFKAGLTQTATTGTSRPEFVDAAIQETQKSVLAEGIRNHKAKFLDEVSAQIDAPDEEVAAGSMKWKPENAKEMAATFEYLRRTGQVDNEAARKAEWGIKTATDIAGPLAGILDAAHRGLIRWPGKALAYKVHRGEWNWKKAWENSYEGWADELIIAGAPKWLAHTIGLPLEAGTDPLNIFGVGLGVKKLGQEVGERVAGEGLSEIAEMAMKQGTKLPGKTKAKLGLYLRSPKTGERVLHGIPGTGFMGPLMDYSEQFAKQTRKVGLTFRSGREPLSGFLRTIYKGMAEEASGEAAFAMRRAAAPHLEKLGTLGVSEEGFKRASMASEFVHRARKGDEMAERIISQITMSDSELAAAEKIRDLFDDVGEVVKTFELPTEPMKKTAIEKAIARAEKNAAKSGQLARQAFGEQDVGEAIARQMGMIGEMEPEKAMKALRGYRARMGRQAEELGKKSGFAEDIGEVRKIVESGGDIGPGAGIKPPTSPADLPTAQTAKKGTWYHGTQAEGVQQLESKYSKAGLFGTGVYMTDDPKIAASYAKSGGKIFTSKVSPKKVLNLETALPDDAKEAISEWLTGSNFVDQLSSDTRRLMAKEGVTGDEALTSILDDIAGVSQAEGITSEGMAEAMGWLEESFRGKGYDALTHIGGKRAGKGEALHRVLIMLDPEDTAGRYGKTISKSTSAGASEIMEQASRAEIASKRLADLTEKMKTPTGTYRAAMEAEAASTQLGDVIQRLERMHPEELKQTLGKTVRLKDVSSKTPSKLPNVAHEIQSIYNAQVLARRQADRLRKAAQGKSKSAIKQQAKLQELFERAEKLDRNTPPAWVPRVSAREQQKAVPQALKEGELFSPTGEHGVSPLGKTGATKARVWLDETGQSRYLWDIEQDFRGMAKYHVAMEKNPKFGESLQQIFKGAKSEDKALEIGRGMLGRADAGEFQQFIKSLGGEGAESMDDAIRVAYRIAKDKASGTPKLGNYLESMFGTGDPAKYSKEIEKMVAEGSPVVGKFFELDPNLSIIPAFNRITKEVENKSLIDGLRMVAVDEPPLASYKQASELGPQVAQRYPGKWFPGEIKDELIEWTRALKDATRDKTTLGNVYDTANQLWKFEKTGIWPSFHFRNMVSDLFRASTLGPYNPIDVYKNGTNAITKSSSVMDLGKMGKMTGAELRDLADAYRITGGYYAEMGLGESKALWKKPLRMFSAGEDIRRVGFFAEQLKKGYSPIEASRRTKKVFFDYSDLAPWEKTVAKRVMPFWTFRRKNMAFQVETLLTKPWYTAAQTRVLRGRKEMDEQHKSIMGGEGVADWMPDMLRGNMGLITSEPGMTNITYGLGLDAQDLVGVLDAFGHPKGAFEGFLEQASEGLSPVFDKNFWKGASRSISMLPTFVGLAKLPEPDFLGNDEIVKAPVGAEKLPESVRSALGIEKRKMPVGRRGFKDAWSMPSGNLAMMRSYRALSELMKLARVDRTQDDFDIWKDQLVAGITGITNRQITDIQATHMVLEERLSSMRKALEEKGYVAKNGRLTKEGVKTKMGKEYNKLGRATLKAWIKRSKEEEAKREQERDVQD